MRSRDSRPRRNGVRNPSAWLVGGLVVLALCGGVAACGDDGSSGGGADATEVRLVTYRLVRAAREGGRAVREGDRGEDQRHRERRLGGDADQGVAVRRLTRGRRHLRNRQHVGHPGDVGGPARAVPRSTDRLAPSRRGPRRRSREPPGPIDRGDVCINVDQSWFSSQSIAPPTTLAELTDPSVPRPAGRGEPGHVVTRSRVPDRHRRPLRRGGGGLLAEAEGQRRLGPSELGRRLLDRLHGVRWRSARWWSPMHPARRPRWSSARGSGPSHARRS